MEFAQQAIPSALGLLRLKMSKIIIGCDPDSSKSGIAVYRNGKLSELSSLSLIDLYRWFELAKLSSNFEIELHIENVKGVSGIFSQRTNGENKGVALKMAQHVGMCKQVQTEIERIAEHFEVKVLHHQVSKMWKKNKSQFEKVTGWTGRSNEDSRSAAWFGYLGLTAKK